MNYKIKILSIMLVLVLTLSTTTPLVYATSTQSEIDDEISEIENDKKDAADELDSTQASYDEIVEATQELSKEINATETDIENTKSQISDLNDQIDSQQKEIDKLQEEIDEKNIEADELKNQSDTSLVVLQEMNNQNMMVDSLFGDSDNIGEMYNRAESTQVITSSVTTSFSQLLEILVEIEALQAENIANKEQLTASKDELTDTKKELTEQKELLSDQKDENDKLIAQLETEIEKQTASVEEFESSIEDLEAQKSVLEAAGCGENDVYGVDCAVSGSGNSGGSSVTAPEVASSGFTRPTTQGTITNPYGYAGYDVTGSGFHPGIDIGATCGTPLYASAPGTVLYTAQTYSGYGNYVVIVHNIGGQNYVSLYGHMQAIYVSAGQTVDYDTNIGLLGTSGSSTGCHVHFSINTGTTLASYSELNRFVDPNTLVDFPATGGSYYSRY